LKNIYKIPNDEIFTYLSFKGGILLDYYKDGISLSEEENETLKKAAQKYKETGDKTEFFEQSRKFRFYRYIKDFVEKDLNEVKI